ncbi:hypothetical protein BRSU_2589 [Brachyspira suanatina]|uniref:Uncharacterized protein n=1 Tax=Brachyspira suanatina TaxID=381802 RepID=A0A0G4KAC4_9SPIR|nr:hypothetical protein [Brachyspira suanatina]CRF35340.1 hypothetical protein BRSU_2589 [Brachyspira suanatina]
MSDYNNFMDFFTAYRDKNIHKEIFFTLFEDLYLKEKTDMEKRISKLPINKKKYNLQQISKEVFNTKIYFKKKSELTMYYKVQFEAMLYVFEDYYKMIIEFKNKEDFYKDEIFNGYLEYYSSLYCNILRIIEESEVNYGIEASQMAILRNRINSYETFISSLRLKNNLSPFSYIPALNNSVFLIRQSIELKLKNILGIDYIINSDNGKLIKIPGDKLLNFVFNNENIKVPNTLEIEIIKKIHNWTQIFIHGGFVINIWQIHIAHIVLNDFFSPNTYSDTEKKIFSIYGSVKMSKDYYNNQLETELINYLKKDPNITNQNIKIIKLKDPEAIIY